jgi:hypothetical protein
MSRVKFILIPILFILPACSSLTLTPADFSWPVESVLKVNEDGFVKEDRYSLLFDTKNLFLEETEDSLSYLDKEIRVIRDTKGYYYITSNNFKNVYVFSNGEGKLQLDNKILISEAGVGKPAFNQRPPYIELLNGSNKHLLSNDGIENEDDNED